MNCALIETYLHVRDNLDELLQELKTIESQYYAFATLDEKAEYYYKQRTQFNTLSSSSLERSALFIFLNKTGFNGMYRENASGGYNIPFGKRKQPIICDSENLALVSSVLKQIDIKCGSYEEAVKEAKAGDFIYFDPPYEPINRTSRFTEYQAGGFGQDDQRKLSEVFRELSDKGCFVMMSNSTADLIKELYADFSINKITVSRGINANQSARDKIEELIITNYEPEVGEYVRRRNEAKG